MSRRKLPQKPSQDVLTHLGELLDQALEQTFPASDPVAIDVGLRQLRSERSHDHLRAPLKNTDQPS